MKEFVIPGTSIVVRRGEGVSWSEDLGIGNRRVQYVWDGENWMMSKRGWDAVNNGRSFSETRKASDKEVKMVCAELKNSVGAGFPIRRFF